MNNFRQIISCVAGNSYIIKSGDTLHKIAQEKLGDSNHWTEIRKPNGTSFTEDEAVNLRPGEEIWIPQLATATPNDNEIVKEILAAHNKYRLQLGISPLNWSKALADKAQQWADHLAQTGRFEQSGPGQNLAMGTTGEFSLTDFVDIWGQEQEYFIPDITFPHVSTTGSWVDVAHYTQVVWKNTTEVGCGIARGNGRDILVCQYNPPGNAIGHKVY